MGPLRKDKGSVCSGRREPIDGVICNFPSVSVSRCTYHSIMRSFSMSYPAGNMYEVISASFFCKTCQS